MWVPNSSKDCRCTLYCLSSTPENFSKCRFCTILHRNLCKFLLLLCQYAQYKDELENWNLENCFPFFFLYLILHLITEDVHYYMKYKIIDWDFMQNIQCLFNLIIPTLFTHSHIQNYIYTQENKNVNLCHFPYIVRMEKRAHTPLFMKKAMYKGSETQRHESRVNESFYWKNIASFVNTLEGLRLNAWLYQIMFLLSCKNVSYNYARITIKIKGYF